MRAFVAVLLSQEVRAALSRASRRALPRGVRVKWVGESNLHVTLAFLGDVTEERIAPLNRALFAASEKLRSFELVVRGLGRFPARGGPRVLWAGADGGPSLIALAAEVERSLVPEGVRADERGFHPHVTLGRVEGVSREPWWPEDPEIAFGKVEVASFALMESRLGPAGPTYREAERFPLLGR